MKLFRLIVSLLGLIVVALFPLQAVLAHERQMFTIGGEQYLFVIGSLNEPVFVDDKTGVELQVQQVEGQAAGHSHGEEGTPVEGLDQTLKVELQAGGKTKTLALSPAFGEPGTYKAEFFPTVATTYTYRIFGAVEDTPIDVSFTCNPAGHPQTEDDTSTVEISEGVTRTLKAGTFGCPRDKAEAGFPEPAVALSEAVVTPPPASDSRALAVGGLIAGLLGLGTGVAAWMKVNKPAA